VWPAVHDWIWALYIIAPIYCTNGAPVLFGGGRPIDSGRYLADGERIFGDHKTVRGLVSGLLVGVVVGLFEAYFFSAELFLLAVLASLGALAGDLAGAFVKRRLRIKPGRPLPLVDQLDFVVVAILFLLPAFNLSLATILIVLVATPPVHVLTNLGAYALGLKRNYW